MGKKATAKTQQIEISKPIRAMEDSWVLVYEYPLDGLVLEGIRQDDYLEEKKWSQRIRFSRKAIKELIPLMQAWLDKA